MSLFGDDLKPYKKADEPIYKTPKSVQQTIEIYSVHENGIFRVGHNKYAKSYWYPDINYATESDDRKTYIQETYGEMINSLDCCIKFTINNKDKNMDQFEELSLIPYKEDGFDHLRKIYNDIIEEKIVNGKNGIEQEKYLTVIIERKSYEEAKIEFATVEANLRKFFWALGSDIIPLDGNERLNTLYDIYHLGNERTFRFDLKEYKKNGRDFKNDLCNGLVKYHQDYFEDEKKFGKALFIKSYQNGLDEDFLIKLTSFPNHIITSVDIVPIPNDVTIRILQKKAMGIESDIIKQQRVRNRNNDFSSEISYTKRMEKKELEALMGAINDNDQRLFYVGVIMILFADTKHDLELLSKSVMQVAKGKCTIDTHYLKQREALNTALPIGVRQVETMRTLITGSAVSLIPFNVQELQDPGGLYYGVNQQSLNVIIGNRKRLINGNGFYFGVPGSGKSFFCKMEMGNVILGTDDVVLVIDPSNEYIDVAAKYGGTVINMSSYTQNFVNPMYLDVCELDVFDKNGLIHEKNQFILSLCEQIMGKVHPRQRSIIGRCVSNIYLDIAKREDKYVPVMSDLYEMLLAQPEPEAKDIALALEIFVNGSLNIFNHQTNVDVDNRFVVYGIRDLGRDLSPVAMLVMMESIRQRIIENSKAGKATWLYIDEFHTLLHSDYTEEYLYNLWKQVRKLGGLCTGITQNISDLLNSDTATTLLSNSEFVVLLKQSNPDVVKVEEKIGITPAQLNYVTNSQAGTGIMKFGNKILPFDNRIDKDNELYQLYNTNLHEKADEKKKLKLNLKHK